MLRPASGFQSWQFKELEAKLGLRFENRHGSEYYTAQLKSEHVDLIKKAETGSSLLALVCDWLERMPFLKEDAGEKFWDNYRQVYQSSLADAEKQNMQAFDEIFFGKKPQQTSPDAGPKVKGNPHEQEKLQVIQQAGKVSRSLSPEASRAALFIMLFRGYPILHLPFQLLNALLDIDEQLSSWRYRHMNMVHRMIGARIGTGGSSGKDYLKTAADKHYIFKEFAELNSFLIERRKLPKLSGEIERRLGFQSF
jgi:tryptophan 2,3-dioxygenase